ncbi:hypothetical protein HFP99_10155 [Aeromonas hydrophila]|nr:hypothetical protein HFP99_10155 [Aeromonas hydrophila]
MFSSRKVPVIHQSEISECGLACLNMIAIYHGHSFPMSYLRKHFPSRVTGTKLRELMDIATEIGFYSRAVRVERHELKNIQLPCILHWDVNHYVVLSHIKKMASLSMTRLLDADLFQMMNLTALILEYLLRSHLI